MLANLAQSPDVIEASTIDLVDVVQLVYEINCAGPRLEPYGTPDVSGIG